MWTVARTAATVPTFLILWCWPQGCKLAEAGIAYRRRASLAQSLSLLAKGASGPRTAPRDWPPFGNLK